MKILQQKSVLFHYLMSYGIIIVLACMLFGLIFFFSSVNEINQTYLASSQNKLDTAAADLSIHMEVLEDISCKIKFESYFKPSFFKRNKYYEIELLESLAKYSHYSPLIDEFFLYYEADSLLYSSRSSVYKPDVFWHSEQGIADWQGLWEKITLAQAGTAIRHGPPDNGFILFVFPIDIVVSSTTPCKARVVFISKETTIRSRIKTLSGLSSDAVLLYEQDNPVLLSDSSVGNILPSGVDPFDDTALAALKQPVLASDKQFSPFRLLISKSTIMNNPLLLSYKWTLYIAMGTIIIILCLVGVYLAYKNYRPIKKLYSSVNAADELGFGKDELQNIELKFEQIKIEEANNKKIIQRQMDALRHQMVDIILSSGLTPSLRAKALQMGLELTGPYFCVVAVCLNGGGVFAQLEKSIWDLLGSSAQADVSVYCGNIGSDNCFSILLDLANEQANKEKAVQNIVRILKGQQLTPSLGVSETFRLTSYITTALFQAHAALRASQTSDLPVFDYSQQDEQVKYEKDWLEAFRQACKKKDFLRSTSMLDELVDKLNSQNISLVYQRFLYTEFHMVLQKIARENSINVLQEDFNAILAATSPAEFHNRARAAILSLHKHTKAPGQVTDTAAGRIIQYIHEYCCDYNMSLELLSSEFGYSASQLSRLIKDYVGEPFRSHLTSLRMEKAKELLQSELTVAEIAQQVGYGSISHFTKIFTNYFGNTPSSYRSLAL